jgi:hypothetical protein
MKYFLDQSLALGIAHALGDVTRPGHEHIFTHFRDKFSPDTRDENWIRTLGEEGGWIVLSGDYRTGKSEHRGRAWQESGLTVFILSQGWQQLAPRHQLEKLAGFLPNIIQRAQTAKTGACFTVSVSGRIRVDWKPH